MESGHEPLIASLAEAREEFCFPPKIASMSERLADDLLSLLFPHFADEVRCESDAVRGELLRIEGEMIGLIVALQERFPEADPSCVGRFIAQLDDIYRELMLDARSIFDGDPAASSVDEVVLTYPGFLAIALYRLAHALHRLGVPILPRLISRHAHHHTGVDIHPAATIGRSFFIDHATGIVIGETTVIGNGVKLYQGVTLGAAAVSKALAQQKRHPTLEDNVVVYANATILGGDTVIGHDTVVGANAWVTESVPPFSVVGRQSDVRPRRSGRDEILEFNI